MSTGVPTDSGFQSFYNTLSPGTFKYFLTGDSYSVYGSDVDFLPAELQARSSSPYSTDRVVRLADPVPTVRELLTARRVPVEEYSGRSLTKSGSPANYNDFMDICLDDRITPTLGAVLLERADASDAFVTVFSFVQDGIIMTTSFTDDDLFGALFSLVSTYNCIELLFADPLLERVIHGWGITGIRSVRRSHGGGRDDTAEMIRTHLGRSLPSREFVRGDVCLVNIRDFDLADFGCTTKQGRRLLEQWLRSPSVNEAEIAERLDLSEAFSAIQIDLSSFSDLKRITAKLCSRRVSSQEMVKTHQMALAIPGMVGLLSSYRGHTAAKPLRRIFVEPLDDAYKVLRPFIEEIERKMDMESARIRPDVSERLRTACERKQAIMAGIAAEYDRVSKILPRVKYQNRAFKVTRGEYSEGLFEQHAFAVISVLKTGVTFQTRSLSETREGLERAEADIQTEEQKELDTIRTNMAGCAGALDIFNNIIALIDIFRAFSVKTTLSNYSRPVFSADGRWGLRGFFHPLLENRDCIPNDMDMGGEGSQSPAKRLCILTGPNMGGKSTVLKALSMASLYAQVGCYVPASRATLPIFDRIFLRIGATDHSSQGHSTFMVEMLDLKKILRTATARSLVLIDELGRGTSAVDGLSLVLAVKEYLVTLGAYTVMATHFSGVGGADTVNMKMAICQGVLTYRLTEGLTDSSFGINVGILANFPASVIEAAEKYLREGEDN